MTITFPQHLRGRTSGALKQIRQNGITTAGGGYVDLESMKKRIVAEGGQIYFSHNEPAGVFMSTLEKTQENIKDTTDAICEAGARLVEMAKSVNKQMADVTGKVRDGSEKLSVAIDKMMKITGRHDFAETVAMTESLVSSLERLAVLEEKGLLDKVMKAMATN